jgi:ATP phosphoribosyltransferase
MPQAPAAAPRAIVLAVPKGRILAEALPLLAEAGMAPDPAVADEGSRALMFASSRPDVQLVRVRSFDVATFVAFGGAQLGIVGNDVVAEFGYSELYAPVDLGIGRCRLSVATSVDLLPDLAARSHVRVATKYPALTAAHFARRGIQADCVKLNGAMELAPALGLAPVIVDLVSSGRTLAENRLAERETILEVTSRLVVNRAAFKTDDRVAALVQRFRDLARARGGAG